MKQAGEEHVPKFDGYWPARDLSNGSIIVINHQSSPSSPSSSPHARPHRRKKKIRTQPRQIKYRTQCRWKQSQQTSLPVRCNCCCCCCYSCCCAWAAKNKMKNKNKQKWDFKNNTVYKSIIKSPETLRFSPLKMWLLVTAEPKREKIGNVTYIPIRQGFHACKTPRKASTQYNTASQRHIYVHDNTLLASSLFLFILRYDIYKYSTVKSIQTAQKKKGHYHGGTK